MTERSEEAVEALADSITGCLSNYSDLPEWMRGEALGRDTRPLLLLAARAVLRSDWLASDRAAQRRAGAEERLASRHPRCPVVACGRGGGDGVRG